MTNEGYWDLYGNLSGAFDADSLLTLAEVEKILERRHEKAIYKKAK